MISQLFFPIKGILVVYDRETKTYAALPGADDPQYVQTNAVWSPDGKEIVFARTTAYHAERLDQQNSASSTRRTSPSSPSRSGRSSTISTASRSTTGRAERPSRCAAHRATG
jgi:Tol biopolymer transport system component